MFHVIFKYKCKKKIVAYSSKTSNAGTNSIYLFVQSVYYIDGNASTTLNIF